jgi:predicted small metal-binding protein
MKVVRKQVIFLCETCPVCRKEVFGKTEKEVKARLKNHMRLAKELKKLAKKNKKR